MEELGGGIVYIGHNTSCKIKGIGKLWQKMHDGTIWGLIEVRYILDMKQNLISLVVRVGKNL